MKIQQALVAAMIAVLGLNITIAGLTGGVLGAEDLWSLVRATSPSREDPAFDEEVKRHDHRFRQHSPRRRADVRGTALMDDETRRGMRLIDWIVMAAALVVMAFPSVSMMADQLRQ